MRGTRPLNPASRGLVGKAFTLRFVPAREDLATPESWSKPISTRGAIEAMPPGCIAVADARGVTDAGHLRRHPLRAHEEARHRRTRDRRRDARRRGRARDRAAGVVPGAAAPPSVAALTFVNWGEPIGCGGVAVFPDDWVVVDDDGAVPDSRRRSSTRWSPPRRSRSASRAGSWSEVRRALRCPGLYPPECREQGAIRKDEPEQSEDSA
jgi:hypothetical protein